jgi:formylmethanofuran dehydrogenase subunit C
VTDHVTLTLRAPLTGAVDLDCVVPDQIARLTEAEIAALPVWSGRQQGSLGDWFDVRGARSARVRIAGDVRLGNGIGTAMTAGELMIDSGVRGRVGAGMTGGSIEVRGSAGDDVGAGMTGGSIHVRGDAGDRVGGANAGASRGVTGGDIVIDGSVGSDAGDRMRRGLLFVGGRAGDRPARSIIAGTVIVLGDTGAEPATGSKRGSLVVGGRVEVPETYRYACTFDAPHVRLALTHVARRYGVHVDPRFVTGPYRRYSGDAGTVARGEILQCV